MARTFEEIIENLMTNQDILTRESGETVEIESPATIRAIEAGLYYKNRQFKEKPNPVNFGQHANNKNIGARIAMGYKMMRNDEV